MALPDPAEAPIRAATRAGLNVDGASVGHGHVLADRQNGRLLVARSPIHDHIEAVWTSKPNLLDFDSTVLLVHRYVDINFPQEM